MPSQRQLKYFEPGILFTILGILHAALLVSFAHGTVTKTVTVETLPYVPQATPPSQTISFPDPANPDATVIFECPDKCHGGAACEWVNPTNCSEYINCDYRRPPLLLACDDGLHFWDQLKQCAPPVQAKCNVNKAKRVGNQDL
jgi:NAD-dependent dihydropyrimidine dehydrogenase PreA subunit